MPTIVIDVMPKPEILDPQGQAVADALPRIGVPGVTAVRQGKRFELQVAEAPSEAQLVELHRAAETLLSNPVIEEYALRVEG